MLSTKFPKTFFFFGQKNKRVDNRQLKKKEVENYQELLYIQKKKRESNVRNIKVKSSYLEDAGYIQDP